MLVQGAAVSLHNARIKTMHAFLRHFGMPHPDKRLENIAEHIGRCVSLPCQHGGQRIVTILSGNARQHRHRLYPVICKFLVIWTSVLAAGPEDAVVRFLYPIHRPLVRVSILFEAKFSGEFCFGFERQHIPVRQQCSLVLVVPGVGPVPASFAVNRQSVVVKLPGFVEVTVQNRVYIGNERVVIPVK